MIKQNTSGLYLQIQKIGCFFISACNMAQLEAKNRGAYKKELSIPELNRIWDQALVFQFIDSADYTMKNSAGVANLAAETLNLPVKFREVATERNGVPLWYSGIGEKRADYRIKKIFQGGPSKTHFILVDRDGNLIEDPHEPPIKSLGVAYTIFYRVDEKK